MQDILEAPRPGRRMRDDPRSGEDPAKRELFTKLAEHYKVLAAEAQRAINERYRRSSE